MAFLAFPQLAIAIECKGIMVNRLATALPCSATANHWHKWMTATWRTGSAHQVWNNGIEGKRMTPRRDSLSQEQGFGDVERTHMTSTTILSTPGGQVMLNPTDGVKPKILTFTRTKGRAMMKEMTHSILRKGQHPPTKSDLPR